MVKFLVKSKEELEKEVAKLMLKQLENKNPKFILATGNSPVGVYSHLIEAHIKEGVSFKKLVTYNLDEYRDIDKFKEDSFREFMNNNLFNGIDIKIKNTHFPNNEKEYNKKLDKIDKFNFTLLGVGTNGHIAFNEPGTSFETRTNIVELTQSTIDSNFPNRTEHPTKAITMGLYDIYNKSSQIVLLAWGENKAESLNKLKEGKKDDNWPITHFIDHPNITIVTDLKEFDK